MSHNSLTLMMGKSTESPTAFAFWISCITLVQYWKFWLIISGIRLRICEGGTKMPGSFIYKITKCDNPGHFQQILQWKSIQLICQTHILKHIGDLIRCKCWLCRILISFDKTWHSVTIQTRIHLSEIWRIEVCIDGKLCSDK